MKKTITFLSLPLFLATTPAIAQDFGGNITLGYNMQQLDPDGYDSGEAAGVRLDGSIGGSVGALGYQLDISNETLEDIDDPDVHSDQSSLVLHAFYDFGGAKAGVFYGTADATQDFLGDESNVAWMGVEVSGNVGPVAVAAQFGQSDNDSTHDALDHSGEQYLALTGAMDVSSTLSLSGGLATGDGIVHGDGYTLTNAWLEGAYEVGSSGVELVVRLDKYAYRGDGAPGGAIDESSVFIGARYSFGNPSATPMPVVDFPVRLSHASAQADN